MENNKRKLGKEVAVKIRKQKDNKKITISINPPPSDNRCECCGRHTSEVAPFGGPGDPLVGDFNGALLVKSFRPMAPKGDIYDTTGMIEKGKSLTKKENKELKGLERKMKIKLSDSMYRSDRNLLTEKEKERYGGLEGKYQNSLHHLNEKKFIEKYGKEKLENYWLNEQATNTIEASWECRDCFVLSNEEYFEKKCGWKKDEKRAR